MSIDLEAIASAHAQDRSTRRVTIEQLAAARNAMPTVSTEEWAADIFGSDEGLDAFLADMRASRGAFLA